MTEAERIKFIGSTGAELSGLINRPSGPVVGSALIAHCFTCSKDIHTVTRLSSALVEAGWLTMAFDFTGLGQSDGEFGNTSVTSEVGDISRAAVALLERRMGPCLLIGHSLGGTAAVLASRRLRTLDAVIAIASPVDVEHVRHLIKPEDEAVIRERGCATVDIGGRPFSLGVGFLDDLEVHDVAAAAAGLAVPLLVVQAGNDRVVDAEQTSRLAAASDQSTLVTVDGADHLFSRREHAEQLAAAVINWLDRVR